MSVASLPGPPLLNVLPLRPSPLVGSLGATATPPTAPDPGLGPRRTEGRRPLVRQTLSQPQFFVEVAQELLQRVALLRGVALDRHRPLVEVYALDDDAPLDGVEEELLVDAIPLDHALEVVHLVEQGHEALVHGQPEAGLPRQDRAVGPGEELLPQEQPLPVHREDLRGLPWLRSRSPQPARLWRVGLGGQHAVVVEVGEQVEGRGGVQEVSAGTCGRR